MARNWFGGGLSQWALASLDASAQFGAGVLLAQMKPAVVVSFYTTKTGSTQLVDLLDSAGVATSTLTTDGTGEIPEFQGPDGVTVMWADAGGPRRKIVSDAGITGPVGPASTVPGPASTVPGPAGPVGPGEPPVYYSGGTYGNRPDTTVSGAFVMFSGPVPPSFGGTVAGGTPQALNNGDFWRKTTV